MKDDSKIKAQGLGQAHPLPNLSLDFVLYISGYPFNLIYVKKLILWIIQFCLLIILFVSKINIQDKRLEHGESLDDYIIYHHRWHVLLGMDGLYVDSTILQSPD